MVVISGINTFNSYLDFLLGWLILTSRTGFERDWLGGEAETIWAPVQYNWGQYPTVAYIVLFLYSPGQAGRLQTTWPGFFCRAIW